MVQVVAAQVAHRAALQAHYYAAVLATTGFTTRNAAILFEADTFLMKLTGEFLSLFGIDSTADGLVIPKGGRHIRVQHPRDAEEIIPGILRALTNVKYVSERRNRKGQMEYGVIGEHRPGRLLFVPIKFVPARRAASGKDEAWVPTSYIINERRVRGLLQKGQLRPVIRRP
jgi:hypothetical protein